MPARLSLPFRFYLGLLLAGLPAARTFADNINTPVMFGPYFKNRIGMSGSPFGYDYVLTNGAYHFQVGWLEPIAQRDSGIFRRTYFETNANLNISPFTSDIGTRFNLKPISFLEIGLGYNRLMFHNSMISFSGTDTSLPPEREYRAENLFSGEQEVGGADLFTYQASIDFAAGPARFYFSAARTHWDIDVKGKDYVYEYGDGLLVATRDRVNDFLAELTYDLGSHGQFRSVSFVGFSLRDQYWFTDQSERKRNLVSAGITGFRLGRNSTLQRRGLDLSLGYWTLHDQIPSGNVAKSLMILANWQWNIHVLKI